MTWRLRSIAIYSKRDGARHVLPFEKGGKLLNFAIISGSSSRGKSTIVEIVDYCLLSKHCTIPKGVFRKTVSHVAVLLEGEKNQMVILRPLPEEGRMTSTEVFVQQGTGIDFPMTPPTRFTWNRDTAKAKLSEFTGIDSPPVLTNFENSDWLERGAANIRHCAPYLFQPQDVIATRSLTFPGIEGTFERTHFIDALRYFLGVFTMADLQKKYELRRLVLERNRIGRQVVESRALRVAEGSRAQGLWSDAVGLGLIEETNTPQDPAQITERLAELVSSGALKVQDDSSAQYAIAQEEEARLTDLLQEKRLELAKNQEYKKIESRHAAVTESQLERLRLQDLLPGDVSTDLCPLCGVGSLDASNIQARLDESLQALEGVRDVPARLRSRLESQCKKLEEEISLIKKSLDQAKGRLRDILTAQITDRSMFNRARALARFEGRILEYLKTAKITTQTLQVDTSSIEERITQLESDVGERAVAQKIGAVQGIIGSAMTVLTQKVDVEFPGKPVRLNLTELLIEVAVDRADYVPLGQLGAGANWLGYHIVMCLALHQYFRLHNRPVPKLLILDQPSQAWFPAASAKFEGRDLPEDRKDLESLQRVYELLSEFSKEEHAPQIVALDHARLGTSSFQDALVADWHEDGKGLVPKQWLDDN